MLLLHIKRFFSCRRKFSTARIKGKTQNNINLKIRVDLSHDKLKNLYNEQVRANEIINDPLHL